MKWDSEGNVGNVGIMGKGEVKLNCLGGFDGKPIWLWQN